MAERAKKPGFWTTLPGILTGGAALLTAVSGLILGLYQYGAFGSKPSPVVQPATADGTSRAVKPDASEPPGTPLPDPSATAPHRRAAASTVLITAKDGTNTTVLAESLRQTGQYDQSLHLLNGQNIAFEKIKAFEIVGLYEDHANVRITLRDDRVVEGAVESGSSTLGFHGENDLGVFDIRMEEVRRIAFQ